MAPALDESLVSSLGEAMSQDREMTVVGKHFTCTVLLASDAERYLVRFEDGKLTRCKASPHPAESVAVSQ